MLKQVEFDTRQQLSEKQIEMLKKASLKPIEYDEDSPELTDEQLQQFKRISEQKRKERQKQNVTIRLSYKSLQKAKSLGKGYTSVLSRILENALNDNETIERYL